MRAQSAAFARGGQASIACLKRSVIAVMAVTCKRSLIAFSILWSFNDCCHARDLQPINDRLYLFRWLWCVGLGGPLLSQWLHAIQVSLKKWPEQATAVGSVCLNR